MIWRKNIHLYYKYTGTADLDKMAGARPLAMIPIRIKPLWWEKVGLNRYHKMCGRKLLLHCQGRTSGLLPVVLHLLHLHCVKNARSECRSTKRGKLWLNTERHHTKLPGTTGPGDALTLQLKSVYPSLFVAVALRRVTSAYPCRITLPRLYPCGQKRITWASDPGLGH